MSAILLGALAALPAYALIVWRPRTRLDETLDVLAAHGLAGFTGILFIAYILFLIEQHKLQDELARHLKEEEDERWDPKNGLNPL